MRVLKSIAGAVHKAVKKRAGLHVYRPVANAQKWADWLKKSGIPNAKTADELLVTIFKATGNVSVIPDQTSHVIRSNACVFIQHGATGLAIAWYDYLYYDRHWTLREVAGSELCHCTSRALLVLSEDIGDFELTDEMLLAAPASIVLDGESTAPLTAEEIQVQKSFKAEDTVTASNLSLRAAAKSALLESLDAADFNPGTSAVLYDLSMGRPVLKSEVAEAPEAAKIMSVDPVETPEPEAKPAPEPKPAADPAADPDETKTKSRVVRKSNERRILYGFAAVSTKDGETVIDYADDEITVDALHDIAHLVVKGARQGALEHNGGSSGEIVEAIVLDKDLCKALSAFSVNGPIELDREAVLVGMHFADDDDWADAKDGDWEFSINATVRVDPPAELEAA